MAIFHNFAEYEEMLKTSEYHQEGNDLKIFVDFFFKNG